MQKPTKTVAFVVQGAARGFVGVYGNLDQATAMRGRDSLRVWKAGHVSDAKIYRVVADEIRLSGLQRVCIHSYNHVSGVEGLESIERVG